MLNATRAAVMAGFTLIELMIAVAIAAILLTFALPSYFQWIQNAQVRTAAETTLSGIQLARVEALKRNTNVRFQLMSTLDASCVPSSTGTNWVVSVKDATGLCHITDPATDPPLLIQAKAGRDGSKNVRLSATQGGAALTTITFSGLGIVTPAMVGSGIVITIDNPTGGTCVDAGGTVRCQQIQVTSSGQARMCDPAVTDTNDSRHC